MAESGASSTLLDKKPAVSRDYCRLKETRAAVETEIRLIEKALSSLSDQERLVLERLYVFNQKSGLKRLGAELGYGQAQMYRIKREAIDKFTISMYGMLET